LSSWLGRPWRPSPIWPASACPAQVSFFAIIGPVCLALGVPLELLPLLLAVETVPDIFRTVGNVTADLVVTQAATRFEPPGPKR
jgi:Na+/H+-dicarboxylate symporter